MVRTYACTTPPRDQLLYRYWIITQCETARLARSLACACIHFIFLHQSSPPPFFPPSCLALLPSSRPRLFLHLSLGLCLHYNAPRIKLPWCVRPCSFIGIQWMACWGAYSKCIVRATRASRHQSARFLFPILTSPFVRLRSSARSFDMLIPQINDNLIANWSRIYVRQACEKKQGKIVRKYLVLPSTYWRRYW